jgi:ferredoxin-NADP reductase
MRPVTRSAPGRKSAGVALIAGGCGIAGALGILRQIRDTGSSKPVRLIYGNRVMEQMIFQDEISDAGSHLRDFEQVLAVEEPAEGDADTHHGQIDDALLKQTFASDDRSEWTYYVCGSKGMVEAVVKNLRGMGIPAKQILYEQLAF